MAAIAAALIGGGVALAGTYVASRSASKAASASVEASRTQAASQQKSLDYLKEVEALPREYREKALMELGGLFGLEGEEGLGMSQQEKIDLAKNSPLYDEIMGSKEAGEEAIMRNASMTGGLRSGGVQKALYGFNTELEKEALLKAFGQVENLEQRRIAGLQGLSGLPSYAGDIAEITSGIGATQAAGQLGAAQAYQTGAGQIVDIGMGLTQSLMNLKRPGTSETSFSDKRLKKNIEKIDERNNLNWYKWDWNKAANAIGLYGSSEGYMADEVKEKIPEAVSVVDGYLAINYATLEAKND